MSQPVITLKDVGKRYRLARRAGGGPGSLREDLAQAGKKIWSALGGSAGASHHHSDFWALQGVSLEIQQGEVIGIIGKNGAGKSTLFKILSRITEPTTGRVALRGRVASLLEVGTGFHPELSGRENIFLNGAILGMRRAEIRARFHEIVAFAEIEQFLDMPVKHYSSGMYVRLAFAVAAHLDPEILILDEVLAVGDAKFQKRCLAKLHDVAHAGRTVLFISHNLQVVSTLTDRCYLLQQGKLAAHGKPTDVIAQYLAEGAAPAGIFTATPSSESPQVVRAEVQTSQPGDIHRQGDPLRITVDLHSAKPVPLIAFSIQIFDRFGQAIIHCWNYDCAALARGGTRRLVCEIPALRLFQGHYTIATHIAEPEGGCHFQTLEGLCPFEVVMHGHPRAWTWRDGECAYIEEFKWREETI